MRRQIALFALVAATVALPGVGMAQTSVAVVAGAAPQFSVGLERCIRDHANAVEGVVDDLNDATTFLVEKVCAVELATSAREAQTRQMASMRERYQQYCDQHRTGQPTDDEDSPAAMCAMSSLIGAGAEDDGQLPVVTSMYTPPQAVALAANLLLQARAERRR